MAMGPQLSVQRTVATPVGEEFLRAPVGEFKTIYCKLAVLDIVIYHHEQCFLQHHGAAQRGISA